MWRSSRPTAKSIAQFGADRHIGPIPTDERALLRAAPTEAAADLTERTARPGVLGEAERW